MAVFLLDTSVFSALMRRNAGLHARIAAMSSSDRLLVCTIVVGEVRYGLARLPRGRRKRSLEDAAAAWLSQFVCEAIPEEAANHYARIKSHLARRGTPLDENDLWIAATAQAIGATLVSSDTHFRRVPGIDLETWTMS